MAMSKIPDLWNNLTVEPEFMIAEGNKVFTKVNAKAEGMIPFLTLLN